MPFRFWDEAYLSACYLINRLSMVDYFAKIRSNADQLAAAGRPMREEDIITAFITGLDSNYEPLITAITTRIDVMTLGERYSHAISFERRREYHAARLQLHTGGSSVNYVARDNNDNSNNRGKGNYRGKGRGNSGDRGDYNNNNRGGYRGDRGVGGGNRQNGNDNRGGDRGDHSGGGDARL